MLSVVSMNGMMWWTFAYVNEMEMEKEKEKEK
jgi:hypothetical protein